MSDKTLVWDIPTRLCHWLLVASIFYAWLAVEILEDMEQHFRAGYTALTLILFRIIWGFVGTHYARFSSFLFSPQAIAAYAKSLNDKGSKPFLGHNPIGSVSVFLLIFVIGLQSVSGLFNSDDYYFGALNYLASSGAEKTFSLIHEWNFDVIIVLIAMHVIAIVFYRLCKNQHLTSAMIHGRKTVSEDAVSAPHISSKSSTQFTIKQTSKLVLAAVIFAVCASSVYLLATALPEPPASETYDYY